MILVVIEVVLVTVTCLTILPSLLVMLAAAFLDGGPTDLPVARLVRKRETGRRFQRPAYQQLS